MSENRFDLEERTTRFSENIVELCKSIKLETITEPIIKQLVRAGTSVGANYMEANNACSKKDFKNKIFICKKEIRETRYWIQILQKAVASKIENVNLVKQEALELNLIFQKIITTLEKGH